MDKVGVATADDLRASGRAVKTGIIEFKRTRILQEASSLFYSKGYAAATLDMIAERLGVTKPFLYTYFRNKGDILSAICELGVKESLAALDRAEGSPGTSVDHLRAALEEVATIIIERHEYIAVYQREMMSLERADTQRILRLRHEFDVRVSRLVATCRRDGFVTLQDATEMSVWIGGLLSWITNFYRPGSRRSREALIEQVVHACMRLIGLD